MASCDFTRKHLVDLNQWAAMVLVSTQQPEPRFFLTNLKM